MKVRIRYEGIQPPAHSTLQTWMEEWAQEHLVPRLSRNGASETVLYATLLHRPKGAKKYVAKLHMHLPGKRIVAANGENADLRLAVESALARLERETDRALARLRKQDEYRRRARRKRLRELKVQLAAVPEVTVAAASASIEPLIPRLEQIARHELAYLRAAGDLPSDYPSLRDVVDEALISVKGTWKADQDQDAVFRELLRALFKVLDREVAASRQFGEMVSLEAAPEPDAEDQAEAMVGEEFYEFYQPDEALRLADVITDESAPLPESDAAEAEQKYMVDVIKDLPITWRRAFLLRELEGMSQEHIAWVLDISESQVAAWIGQADAFVSEKFRQAGLSHAPRQSIAAMKPGSSKLRQ